MWSVVSSTLIGGLADGLKEFKAAFEEVSEAEEAEESRAGPVVAKEERQSPSAGESEKALSAAFSIAPVDGANVFDASPKLVSTETVSATAENEQSWASLMHENEIRRLRAEIEHLRSQNKELQERVLDLLNEQRTDSVASRLKEENRLLKQSLANLMDKVSQLGTV